VTEKSPDLLVFKPMEPSSYTGRVVHGVTGESLPGAIILSVIMRGKTRLSELNEFQWEQLEGLNSSLSLKDPRLNALRQAFVFVDCVQTDLQGRFEIASQQGAQPHSLVGLMRDYIPVSRHCNHDSARSGTIEMGEIELYPAARVYVNISMEADSLLVSPRWIFAEDLPMPWISRLDYLQRGGLECQGWIGLNQRKPVTVPAGIPLQLILRTPYDKQHGNFIYPQAIELQQGEELNLGPCTFASTVKAYVLVVDAKQRGLAGVPVSVKSGQNWGLPRITDEHGVVQFQVSPLTQGTFVVTDHGRSRKEPQVPLVERIPFTASGPGDKGKTVLFELSDEMVKRLGK
jgi:hypothetical protein